jgi:hypothetical protein
LACPIAPACQEKPCARGKLLAPHASCTPIYGVPGARSMRLPGVPVEKLRFVASYDESLFFNKPEELIY